MEDRYRVHTGMTSPVPYFGRRIVTKAALGLAAIASLSPLADVAHGQFSSSASVSQTNAQRPAASEIDAPWIWSPRYDVNERSDQGEVFFRKKFTLIKPERAELKLAAGDEFELFINGEMVATGQSFGAATELDPTPFLKPGVNLIAVRIKHIDSAYVGLAMKMRIKEAGEIRYRVLRTDESWKSYTATAYEWHKNGFNSASWLTSKVIGGAKATPKVAIYGAADQLKNRNHSDNLSLEKKQTQAGFSTSKVTLSPMSPVAIDSIKNFTQNTAASKQSIAEEALAQKAAKAEAFQAGLDAAKKLAAEKAAVEKLAVAEKAAAVKAAAAAKKLAAEKLKAETLVAAKAAVAKMEYNKGAKASAGLDDLLLTDASNFQAELGAPPAPTGIKTSRASKPAKVVKSRVPAPTGFQIDPEFTVTQVLSERQTGSVIAMEFNEYGQLLLSREGGPLVIADLTAESTSQQVRVFCNEVSSCQGILPLNGDVFVTAEGPDGQGLYRLADGDGDGTFEVADTLLKFTGQPGEHGPHGVTLGPDGKLYVTVGNGSRLKDRVSRRSPYQFAYEGDLVSKYEDPSGQASGAVAPGGTIVRVGIDGSRPETVAGGIRNAYDLVFDENGELFIHDSDMEGDRGTTWYRPPMIFNITDGADLGWRSGWSKFATYYPDQLEPICDTGRGSPSGAVVYQHLQFPKRYQNALFFADWSEGKIYSFKKKPSGASFSGSTEVFLSGKPMNVCDLSVGQDGALYFCTGGRGTKGGVYKVAWSGEVPKEVLTFENDLAKVLRHPQPNAAWARQNIAELRRLMGGEWSEAILGAITEERNPAKFRVRGMQLSLLYGPQLPNHLLMTLAQDESAEVRAQVARMCGSSARSADNKLLLTMLNDSSALVRRKACEGLLRADLKLSAEQLVPMLESDDRTEALAARRLLERIDANQWQDQLVNGKDIRLFIQSSLALMASQPTLDRAYEVLAQSSVALDGFLSDEDFLDLIRVIQVTLSQGKVQPDKIPAFVKRLGEEFPAGSPVLNLELVKTLAGLNVGDLDGRIASWLRSPSITDEERFQAVMYFHRSSNKMTASTRAALADAVADLKVRSGGGSYRGYLQLASQSLGKKAIGDKPLNEVIAGGDQWPEDALKAFYTLPNPLTAELAQSLKTLDQKLVGRQDLPAKKVRLGIIALLAEDGSDASFSYLREQFDREPARQADIAIGLALQPENDNWAYLVSSLAVIDDQTGQEILQKLASVKRRPKAPIHYRDAIDLGYRLRGNSDEASKLLSHWTGRDTPASGSWNDKMDVWSNWYTREFPNGEPILASNTNSGPSSGSFGGQRYTTEQVVSYLETNGLGDPRNGHELFDSAQCTQCHQMDGQGQGVGPDLTSIASRFSMREVVEATVDPHKFVDQRFRATTIITDDGQSVTGLATQQPEGSWLVVTPDGQRVKVDQDFVAELKQSQMSTMPTGLLDDLSLAETADLFGYIISGGMNNIAKRQGTPDVSADAFGKMPR